ncbi:MAG: dipeptide epimerase [Gemmatimonadetes bacterium]|nr:dipeptide epimerase [Gemmatimonadota bacterium]MYC69533.1 dipeptide epimerase [Gemmatimonadota bacterium]MYI63316.1 dipeptide epimerase [Gemmatimonadota bacterium]
MTHFSVRSESFPLAQTFTISRGAKTTAVVVVVELSRDGCIGRGECVPYPRYNESMAGTIDALESLRPQVEAGLDGSTELAEVRAALQRALPPGAARNALDCALWDLEAKLSGRPAYELAGLAVPRPISTAYTLSLDDPETMGRAAAQHADRPLLKIKLAGRDDLDRVAAIRANAPDSTLIVDANEGWSADQVEPLSAALARLGVALIEQPLPADQDALLAKFEHPVPFCADESCHTADDLAELAARYEYVNLKLDKTGGFSEGLRLAAEARACGLDLMVGCMIATSLSMAPAVLLAQQARFVDLDGPLLLQKDREHGLRYEGSLLHPPHPQLWG